MTESIEEKWEEKTRRLLEYGLLSLAGVTGSIEAWKPLYGQPDGLGSEHVHGSGPCLLFLYLIYNFLMRTDRHDRSICEASRIVPSYIHVLLNECELSLALQ